MKNRLILLFVGLGIFLSGCIQGEKPPQCASVPKEKFANCIYINAVMEQNPFYCYSLEDKEQKRVCIQDASDASKKAALERADQETRDSIFAPKKPQIIPVQNQTKNNTTDEIPQLPPLPQDPCEMAPASKKDECYWQVAMEDLNMPLCEKIKTGSFRENCIAYIALTTKNSALCQQLTNRSNIDLCRFFSSGQA
ncbi:MAG: hypothetical protein N3G22_00525 [Candidatus Micrarchaeota archaeon]|nr:hypothetical protein [Candidatus Micrarchaeota archaeon]